MTSGSLYFKLLKEDLKRRIWAIALLFLGFFFALPVGLALTMENAANNHYTRFNGYMGFIRDSSMSDHAYRMALLELKTKVVLSQVSFGRILIIGLLIAAAVVIGVSGFSYLHNKRQVDFYHSLPVRREILYSSRYTAGILITGLAYLVNLILTLGVALSYGVSPASIIGPMAAGFALNMLFFLLMYAVSVIAMIMTGNLVVGILGAAVFFGYLPAVMFLLSAYCDVFFLTTTRDMWKLGGSPFVWGMQFLSPLSIYMTALGWGTKQIGQHIPELAGAMISFLVLTALGLWLYCKRPSEAAGKAMAFQKTMAPIRVLLALGCGLWGGMFFWAIQSKLKWGIFGMAVSVILAHCVVEIIYHFDFKRLFGHKGQLAICLGAGILIFLSFFYDWYGYDSYVPKGEQVAYASLDIVKDSNFLDVSVPDIDDSEGIGIIQKPAYEDIEKNMKLTDMSLVMPIVEEGRKCARKERSKLMKGTRSPYESTDTLAADREEESETQEFYTDVTVSYRLKNGHETKRTYHLNLSDVMSDYEKLYSQKEYKTGLYSILTQKPEDMVKAEYKEADTVLYTTSEAGVLSELLKAYQADLMGLDTQTRMEEAPFGTIRFTTAESVSLMNRCRQAINRQGGYWDFTKDSLDQDWPVYPSFTRTLHLLEQQGAAPQTVLSPENVKSISLDVKALLNNGGGDLLHGKALAELESRHPDYRGDQELLITDPQEIDQIMKHVIERNYYEMDPFYMPGSRRLACKVNLINNEEVAGLALFNSVPPEIESGKQ